MGLVMPVILAGGKGARLWPLSTDDCPKQFLKLITANWSLFQETVERAALIPASLPPLIVANLSHKDLVRDQILDIKRRITAGIFEPLRQNTAPSILMAAFYVKKFLSAEIPLVIMPADHHIKNQESFQKSILLAIKSAKNKKIAIIGINPSFPSTQFGYIEIGKEITDEVFSVKQFREKPTYQTAQKFLQNGNFLWNSGMVVATAETILDEMKQLGPELYDTSKECFQKSLADGLSRKLLTLDYDSFGEIEKVSFDYALLERSKNISVVSSTFEWSDLGSWEAISKIKQTGNPLYQGHSREIESSNNFFMIPNKNVLAIGIEDLIIVEHGENILVMKKDHSNSIPDPVFPEDKV